MKPPSRRLLRLSNEKLGRGIWTWSLPSVTTCPGRSPACVADCYALGMERRRTNIRVSYARNLDAARRADFVEKIVAEVVKYDMKVVRWHVSGDVYDAAYARKMLAIFRRCPGTIFYLYTRSWRVPAVRYVVARIARLKNTRVWFSCDRDTGVPVRPPRRVRLAWLQTADGDDPPRSDLVFRVGRLRKLERRTVPAVDGSPVRVCPVETGLPAAARVTCAACGVCWRADPGPPAGRPGVTALPVV